MNNREQIEMCLSIVLTAPNIDINFKHSSYMFSQHIHDLQLHVCVHRC